MKIKYRFVTGEEVEVEVSDNVGTVVLELWKKEASNERYQRLVEERLRTDRSNPYSRNRLGVCEDSESKEKFDKAFESLTDVQKVRLEMVADGCSEREVARREGKGKSAVIESIADAREKFKRNF